MKPIVSGLKDLMKRDVVVAMGDIKLSWQQEVFRLCMRLVD